MGENLKLFYSALTSFIEELDKSRNNKKLNILIVYSKFFRILFLNQQRFEDFLSYYYQQSKKSSLLKIFSKIQLSFRQEEMFENVKMTIPDELNNKLTPEEKLERNLLEIKFEDKISKIVKLSDDEAAKMVVLDNMEEFLRLKYLRQKVLTTKTIDISGNLDTIFYEFIFTDTEDVLKELLERFFKLLTEKEQSK